MTHWNVPIAIGGIQRKNNARMTMTLEQIFRLQWGPQSWKVLWEAKATLNLPLTQCLTLYHHPKAALKAAVATAVAQEQGATGEHNKAASKASWWPRPFRD